MESQWTRIGTMNALIKPAAVETAAIGTDADRRSVPIICSAAIGENDMPKPFTLREPLTQEEQEFLAWFFETSDFGPADCDVRACMYLEYEKQTGNRPPESLTEM